MRAALASSLVAIAIAGSACGEHCSCAYLNTNVNVLLTDADSGTVVPLGFFQSVGVELQGSGRTIAISDPSRMQVWLQLAQPSGKTVAIFNPTQSGTGSRADQLHGRATRRVWL